MNKPVKWGFKLWTLACPVTGYTIDMVVYTASGKRGNVQIDDFAIDGLGREGGWEGWMGNRSLTQLGPSVVIKLCKPYFWAGHVVVTDNFYNNVPLFQFLKNQGMYAIGTAKVNSTGFPQELKDKAAWEKKAVRGGGGGLSELEMYCVSSGWTVSVYQCRVPCKGGKILTLL